MAGKKFKLAFLDVVGPDGFEFEIKWEILFTGVFNVRWWDLNPLKRISYLYSFHLKDKFAATASSYNCLYTLMLI